MSEFRKKLRLKRLKLGGGGGQPARAYPAKATPTGGTNNVKGGTSYTGKSPGMSGTKGLGLYGTKAKLSKTGGF